MSARKVTTVTPAGVEAARRKAALTRAALAHKPGPKEMLTVQERSDAAPFYFELRDYVRELKAAREAAGLTLAEVSARSGLAVESLSRLETGAVTNPTWKTLGQYTIAVGRRLRIAAIVPTK